MIKRELYLGIFVGVMIGWTFVVPWMRAHGLLP